MSRAKATPMDVPNLTGKSPSRAQSYSKNYRQLRRKLGAEEVGFPRKEHNDWYSATGSVLQENLGNPRVHCEPELGKDFYKALPGSFASSLSHSLLLPPPTTPRTQDCILPGQPA